MIRPDNVDLDALGGELVQAATEAGILVLPGAVVTDASSYPLWSWSGEPGTESEFVAIAQRLDVKVIYTNRLALDLDQLIREELQEAHLLPADDIDEEDDEEEAGPDLVAELAASLRHWRVRDGQTYGVALRFFYQGVEHLLFVGSAWFEELGAEITQWIADRKQSTDQDYRDAVNRERTRMRTVAGEFARDERYARATNDRQRQLLAEEMYPDLIYTDIRDVVEKAKYIFQDEVAPQREREQADEARALQGVGDSVAIIATKLGLTKAKVERLLYLAEQEA